MIEGQRVAWLKLAHYPGDDRFFADPQVHLSRDVACLPKLGDSLLEEAAAQH
jgi:hypothetical protein